MRTTTPADRSGINLRSATSVKAIETTYAGYRFRSRLEARWAVFFDALRIKWEYEPQGYLVDGKPYLPDFRLPELDLWVEVKGSLGAETFEGLAVAATQLPYGGPAACIGSPTPRLLILRNLPRGDEGVISQIGIFQVGPLWFASPVRFGVTAAGSKGTPGNYSLI